MGTILIIILRIVLLGGGGGYYGYNRYGTGGLLGVLGYADPRVRWFATPGG